MVDFPQTYYTVKEVASYLKLNPLTIYEYIREGKLRAVKFGRTYRIERQDLMLFIESHKVDTVDHGEGNL